MHMQVSNQTLPRAPKSTVPGLVLLYYGLPSNFHLNSILTQRLLSVKKVKRKVYALCLHLHLL